MIHYLVNFISRYIKTRRKTRQYDVESAGEQIKPAKPKKKARNFGKKLSEYFSGGEQNQPEKPKKNDRNFGKELSEYCYDYSSNTSIQGVKYLGERNRSIIEKLFWLIFLCISLCLCVCLINRVYNKWQDAPVIVTFSNNLTPVWKVPFPAVTICPEGKNRKTAYDYEEAIQLYIKSGNMSAQELQHFDQMSFLCGDSWNTDGNKIFGNDTIDFMFEVAPNSDWWQCKWNQSSGDFVPCRTLLTPVLTNEGVCFTFNMLDREELFTSSIYYPSDFFNHGIKSTNWSLEKGYSKPAVIDDYPRNTAGRFKLDLDLLNYKLDMDFACNADAHGYKVLLHNPAEIPKINEKSFFVSSGKQTIVSIKPDIMTTSDELESYDPQKRQCYYSYERQLKYFQVYRQSNCELECLTNVTLKMCGCVSFYMPRDTATDICGRGNTICMTDAEMIMVTQETLLEYVISTNESEERCNCLPSCTSLSYVAKTSEIDIMLAQHLQGKDEELFAYGLIQTLIGISFNVDYHITTERRELYGLTDFLADCGGFLGLFLGFSFLSIVEIIYFLSLRLICNLRTRRLPFRPGSPRICFNSRVPMPGETCNTVSKRPLREYVLSKHPLTVVDVK